MQTEVEQVEKPVIYKRKGLQPIVSIAVGLILFATVGFVGLQLLATAGTTSFQPVVVLIAITVVSIMAALGAALYFLRHVKF